MNPAELARFLQIARGSASELQYYLMLAYDLGFLRGPDYNQLDKYTGEVKSMLTSFIKKLKADSFKKADSF